MKRYAEETKLPLMPRGAYERYLLYTFETRERSLILQTLALLAALVLWATTRTWVFGILAIFCLAHLYHGFEARAVCRMIRRASDGRSEGHG